MGVVLKSPAEPAAKSLRRMPPPPRCVVRLEKASQTRISEGAHKRFCKKICSLAGVHLQDSEKASSSTEQAPCTVAFLYLSNFSQGVSDPVSFDHCARTTASFFRKSAAKNRPTIQLTRFVNFSMVLENVPSRILHGFIFPQNLRC